jgi:hypothetical protein
MCYIFVLCIIKWNNANKEIQSCDLYGLKTSSLFMMKKVVSLLVCG